MKFYICPADEEFEDEVDLFEATNGDTYFYEVDFDGETVRLTDVIGRSVPFGVDDLPGLIAMLSRINSFTKNTESLNKYLYEKLIEGSAS